MPNSRLPKANLALWFLFLLEGIGLLVISGCANLKQCREMPARVSLEKKIFSLEDQIESQKKKIGALQHQLASRSDQEETLVDSSFENMNGYYEAIQLREAGQYDEAVDKLNRFIVENPDHVYSDRAQFLILDSHFKSKEYGLVLVDSFLLETRYRESKKLPEALHKRALAYLKLGDQEKGKQTLNVLMESYPNSAVISDVKETWTNLQSSEIKQ